jgi:hypothetical protein
MKFLSTLLSALFLAAPFTCFCGGDDKPTKSLSSLGCWSYDMGYTYDLSEQILLLKHVDALSVKNLLIALVQAENKPTTLCFDKNTYNTEDALCVSSPENAFLLFGQKNELNMVKDFIVKHLDVDLVQKPSRLRIDNEQK